ncbi:MAG: MBL fold metallo-hydrolase [Rhodospirillales bacterium]
MRSKFLFIPTAILFGLITFIPPVLSADINVKTELRDAENVNQLAQRQDREGRRQQRRNGPRSQNQRPQSQPTGDGTIKITLLGTGGGPGGGGPNLLTKKMNANTLIEAGGQQFLFDAGRGAMLRLASLTPQHVSRTDKVFLTHLHSDHIVDLSDLFLNGSGRGSRLEFFVWGPTGTAQMTEHLAKAYDWDLTYRTNPRRPKLRMIGKDVSEGVVYEKGGVKVTAFDVNHWPPRKSERDRQEFPAVGYRLDYNGHSVVISGDTRPTLNMVKYAKGVDVLIHEVHVGLDGTRRGSGGRPLRGAHHTSPGEAGEIFDKARPKLAVYTHIVWGRNSEQDLINLTKDKYSGKFIVGQEMMQILVSDTVEVLK